jgi:hypothetical protein
MSWYPYDEDVYSKLSVFPSVRTRDTRRDEKGSSVTFNLMCSGEATGCFFLPYFRSLAMLEVDVQSRLNRIQ